MQENLTKFDRQYLLHRGPVPLPVDWQSVSLREWTLSTSKSLPVVELKGPDQRHMGWILGDVIDADGAFRPLKLEVPNLDADSRMLSDLEQVIYSWSGRFVVIVVSEAVERVYLDAGGSMSLVYSEDRHVCAATPPLIPNAEYDVQLAEASGMPESGGWYPAGLTPYKKVRRLLPNHYLDLRTWTPVRHWPLEESFRIAGDPRKLAQEVVGLVQKSIAAASANCPVYMSITAGYDSRMLVACAQPFADRITFFTFARDFHFLEKDTTTSRILKGLRSTFGSIPVRISDLDGATGYHLARTHQLEYELVYSESATPGEVGAWLQAVGHCVSGSRMTARNFKKLKPGHLFLSGKFGELGRGKSWRNTDREGTPLSPRIIMERLHPGLPLPERTLHEVHRWMDALPSWMGTFEILDMAYLELRMGCWGGPRMWAEDGLFEGQFWPLCHRRIVDIMVSLPVEYKRAQQLAYDIVDLTWPELARWPYNQPSGLRKHLYRAIK